MFKGVRKRVGSEMLFDIFTGGGSWKCMRSLPTSPSDMEIVYNLVGSGMWMYSCISHCIYARVGLGVLSDMFTSVPWKSFHSLPPVGGHNNSCMDDRNEQHYQCKAHRLGDRDTM